MEGGRHHGADSRTASSPRASRPSQRENWRLRRKSERGSPAAPAFSEYWLRGALERACAKLPCTGACPFCLRLLHNAAPGVLWRMVHSPMQDGQLVQAGGEHVVGWCCGTRRQALPRLLLLRGGQGVGRWPTRSRLLCMPPPHQGLCKPHQASTVPALPAIYKSLTPPGPAAGESRPGSSAPTGPCQAGGWQCAASASRALLGTVLRIAVGAEN